MDSATVGFSAAARPEGTHREMTSQRGMRIGSAHNITYGGMCMYLVYYIYIYIYLFIDMYGYKLTKTDAFICCTDAFTLKVDVNSLPKPGFSDLNWDQEVLPWETPQAHKFSLHHGKLGPTQDCIAHQHGIRVQVVPKHQSAWPVELQVGFFIFNRLFCSCYLLEKKTWLTKNIWKKTNVLLTTVSWRGIHKTPPVWILR